MPTKSPKPKKTADALARTVCASAIIECPPELAGEARQEWDRLVPLLVAAGRVKATDRPLLAAFCVAYAAWLSAAVTLQTYGPIMKSPNGHPMQSPAVSIVNQNVDIMIRIAAQFGFTPASRLRLPSAKETSSWDDEIPTLDEIGIGLKPLKL